MALVASAMSSMVTPPSLSTATRSTLRLPALERSTASRSSPSSHHRGGQLQRGDLSVGRAHGAGPPCCCAVVEPTLASHLHADPAAWAPGSPARPALASGGARPPRPLHGTVSRRGVIGFGLLGLGTVAGCSDGSSPTHAQQARATEVAPDVRTATAALAAVRAMLLAIDETGKRFPPPGCRCPRCAPCTPPTSARWSARCRARPPRRARRPDQYPATGRRPWPRSAPARRACTTC